MIDKVQRVVIATSLVTSILHAYHDTHATAHIGVHKLTTICSERFYWKRMSVDIAQWIGSCKLCRAVKDPQPKRQGLIHFPDSNAPFFFTLFL